MKVQVSIRPDQQLEVDDSEYAELHALGLLSETAPSPKPAFVAALPANPAGVETEEN